MSHERRLSARFDKVIAVTLHSDTFGEMRAIARNISTGGMFVEMSDPLPIGGEVLVHFALPESHAVVVARAQIRHQFALNYMENDEPRRACGIGVRFVEFLRDSSSHGSVFDRTHFRTLH